MHVDEWGNVFRMTPKFKVVRNITNAEMADVARESDPRSLASAA